MLTGLEILEITKPEDLFSAGDEDVIKKEYRDFAKRFHPDVLGNATVFSKISELKEQALKILKNGTWKKDGIYLFTDTDGRQFKIKYKYSADFELGKLFVTDTRLIYFIEKKHGSLYTNALKQIAFKYKNENMRLEFERYLPGYHSAMVTEDHYVMIHKKTPDVIPLRGLHCYFKDGLEPTHVAWIMSSLCNMLCYLYWSEKEHLAINIDTYFVSPKHHSGLLLGGWFYCQNRGDKISVVPKTTYHLMAKRDAEKKIAGYRTDTELAKNIGRTMMGKYMSKMKYPEFAQMIDWLMIPSNENPYKMFKSWDKTMMETFGKRKFIKLDVKTEDIYKSM